MNQMFEDEEKGKVKIRAGVPPIRVVALRVFNDSCFTDGPKVINEDNMLLGGRHKLVFQTNLRSSS